MLLQTLVELYHSEIISIVGDIMTALSKSLFDHFPEVKKELGPGMKSTGEAIRFIDSLKDPYFMKIYSERNMHLSR